MFANFYEAGGFGMYPTTLFGFFLSVSAVFYTLRPERRFMALSGSLGLLTLLSGFLGFATGMVNTLLAVTRGSVSTGAPPADLPLESQLKILTMGTAESLNNVVLALILLTLSTLLVSVGALRAARASQAVAPDLSVG